MKLKSIIYEDYTNYCKPSMFLGTCLCDWKCERESKDCHCQNSKIAKDKTVEVHDFDIVQRYLSNPLTHAIVIGGLEPMLQFHELVLLVETFRKHTDDDIVIYTGYYPCEVKEELKALSKYRNILLKFGRYVPGFKPHYDKVLGVELASDNQYGHRLS